MCACLCVFVYVCVHVCVFLCVHEYVYVCMHPCQKWKWQQIRGLVVVVLLLLCVCVFACLCLCVRVVLSLLTLAFSKCLVLKCQLSVPFSLNSYSLCIISWLLRTFRPQQLRPASQLRSEWWDSFVDMRWLWCWEGVCLKNNSNLPLCCCLLPHALAQLSGTHKVTRWATAVTRELEVTLDDGGFSVFCADWTLSFVTRILLNAYDL